MNKSDQKKQKIINPAYLKENTNGMLSLLEFTFTGSSSLASLMVCFFYIGEESIGTGFCGMLLIL